ncbi:homocysteine S-methyltransferase [Terasakiispira papahanaumokuakeensis]|uniref:S-methylmethionine:homocysteine methyltransferase n=1 Tax=Terasakiispira papahanaumokuakeensis TaxID=197479 RepID=A0A1E2VD11_9GAMM|nr:homocysteine S-methyltransferase [Terasakiispira papahanaumokuakeensis]ODC04877.1 homocysteine S-methyltransferase [Terasakiispira papahanaumokuakeensis]
MTTSNPIQTLLQQTPFMLIDGALATELEVLGCDLNDALWSARLLAEAPEKIRQVHQAYFEAGADCTITASYQATVPGFMQAGMSASEARALIQRSVTLAQEARDAVWQPDQLDRPRPLIAASVGPYGAYLADGSEYRGGYDLDRAGLVEFHRERLALLLAAGADLLAVETLPSLDEALAITDLLATHPEAQAWITFSARDGDSISDGTPIAECAAALASCPGVAAIGVNCTALPHIESLIRAIRGACDLPILVYPNSGETYDPVSKTWHPAACSDHADGPSGLRQGAPLWLAAGAAGIGGCCRTGPEDIRALAQWRHELCE